MSCPAPPTRCLQSPAPGTLAGWCCVGVRCVSLQSLAALLVKIRPMGSCVVVKVKAPCSIAVASPVPSHHLGLAQGDTLVLRLALHFVNGASSLQGSE